MFRTSGNSSRTRDKRSIYQRLVAYLRDSRRNKSRLAQPPRTLAEALRDSGSLQIPAGRDRLTGGWL